VVIGEQVARAVAGTRLYLPDDPVATSTPVTVPARAEVVKRVEPGCDPTARWRCRVPGLRFGARPRWWLPQRRTGPGAKPGPQQGAVLPAPYPVSLLMAAAPNRSAIAGSQPQYLPDLPARSYCSRLTQAPLPWLITGKRQVADGSTGPTRLRRAERGHHGQPTQEGGGE
jgi:hypothetical protein